MNCPVGTHFNVVTAECSPCTAGSYQPKEARDTCLVCPGGTFTKVDAGATNEDQCKPQCKPGSYSVDGLENCRTCELGHHQSQYAGARCLQCPHGQSTLFRGATSNKDCQPWCHPGRTSNSGLEPCFPCPQGYFQSGNGTDHCYKCPAGTTTLFQSSDSVYDCVGLENPEQYKDFEILSVNDCFSLPCQNDAACIALAIGFQCQCPPGWRGSVCDIPYDPCHLQPCLNHGACQQSGAEDYSCVCDAGYTGKDCEEDVDECNNNICTNNATCVDMRRTDFDVTTNALPYFCECPDGFRGEYCEENIDDCQNSGCQNKGRCVDGIGTFVCICPLGFM